MKFSYIVDLLWIPSLTTSVCSELYEFAAWPLLVRSSTLTTDDRRRVYPRAAKSPANKPVTSNQKGSPSTLVAPPKQANKPATAASKENIPSILAKPENVNGKGSYPSKSVVSLQDTRPGPSGKQLAGIRTANGEFEENSSKATLKHFNGFAVTPKQKAQKNSMDANSKSPSLSRKTPVSKGVSPKLQTASRGTPMSKDKKGKPPKAGSMKGGKRMSLKSANAGMKSDTRSARASKPSADDEEDGQLCKRTKTGGCKKKTSKRRKFVTIPEMMRSSSSVELGKMRSFWQNHPGVFLPVCTSTAGAIIIACANTANAWHDPHVNSIALAVGASMGSAALGYGIVAGYRGHAAKENLSREHLRDLGDGLASKTIQAPIDAYKKGLECVGKACKAIGLDKAAPCIGKACEHIGLKKPKSRGEEGRKDETPVPAERVESAPVPVTNPRQVRFQLTNPRLNDEIQLTQSGNLRIAPNKPTPPTTGATSSSKIQSEKSEIEPDESPEAETGRLKRTSTG